jgi:hypothetical protein
MNGRLRSVPGSLLRRREPSSGVGLLRVSTSHFLIFKVSDGPLAALLQVLHTRPEVGRERELFLCL